MHIAKIRVAPSFNVFMVTLLQMTHLESLAFLERIKGVSLNLVFTWVLHVQLCTFVCFCVFMYICVFLLFVLDQRNCRYSLIGEKYPAESFQNLCKKAFQNQQK